MSIFSQVYGIFSKLYLYESLTSNYTRGVKKKTELFK